ncbi:MAG TPA: O-antigen ligase family protein [Polyangiaceae bacterium]|nr:O-antigen ligase family protein [Polyangiaceae bacterium]
MQAGVLWARRWARTGLALTVCASALALGGAHIRVVLVATFVVACSGALGFAGGTLRRVPAPALLMSALGAYCLLQSLPLPMGLLRVLSPSAADAWSRSLLPFHESVGVGSLSLDPGASSVEAAKWCGYAVAFTLASSFGRRRGATPVVALVFASALAVALATLGHRLVGASRVFGLYAPEFGTSSVQIGPILNPNCLAGYLVLGALCGLGFMLSSASLGPRWLWGIATAVIAGVVVLSVSRGGVGALLVGIIAFAIFSTRATIARERARRLKWYDWAGVGAALVAAAVFSVLGVDASWHELLQKDTDKLRMWAWVLPMVRDFPLFGVGRGAFESAFPFYKPVANNLVYSHPENLVAQWVCEWGIGVGLAAIGLFAWLLRPSRLGLGKYLSASGALIGVFALLLQNFVDFSLELFAPALAVTVVLGACWGQTGGGGSPNSPRALARLDGLWAPALVGLALLSVALAVVRGSVPVAQERLAVQNQYRRLSVEDAGATKEMWGALRSAIERHPAEPFFPRLGAALAVRLGNVEPLPWIDRSLERCAVDSRTHWILAYTLHQHQHLPQALLEARLAVEYDSSLAATVGGAVARWSPRLEDIERAAPPGPSGSQVRYFAARELDPIAHGALREELLRRAIQHDPRFLQGRRALADELLLGFGTERCEGEAEARCEAEILAQSRALDRLQPDSAAGSEVLGKLLAKAQRGAEADRVLSVRCPELTEQERVKCWRTLLFAVREGNGSSAMVIRAAQHLVKAACLVDQGCENALIQAGEAMAKLEEWPTALDYFERAARRTQTVQALLKVAEAADKLGRLQIAERALALAASRSGSNEALAGQIEKRRQNLLRSVFIDRPSGRP